MISSMEIRDRRACTALRYARLKQHDGTHLNAGDHELSLEGVEEHALNHLSTSHAVALEKAVPKPGNDNILQHYGKKGTQSIIHQEPHDPSDQCLFE